MRAGEAGRLSRRVAVGHEQVDARRRVDVVQPGAAPDDQPWPAPCQDRFAVLGGQRDPLVGYRDVDIGLGLGECRREVALHARPERVVLAGALAEPDAHAQRVAGSESAPTDDPARCQRAKAPEKRPSVHCLLIRDRTHKLSGAVGSLYRPGTPNHTPKSRASTVVGGHVVDAIDPDRSVLLWTVGGVGPDYCGR